jgi:hypothetical protein
VLQPPEWQAVAVLAAATPGEARRGAAAAVARNVLCLACCGPGPAAPLLLHAVLRWQPRPGLCWPRSLLLPEKATQTQQECSMLQHTHEMYKTCKCCTLYVQHTVQDTMQWLPFPHTMSDTYSVACYYRAKECT